MPLDHEAIIAGITPAPPDLARLETLVSLAEERDRRADTKLTIAQTEKTAATEALKRARNARADWIRSNPDPQMMLL
ncbi:hypothetical protein [Novosphingobium sp.]|uniref:hypothetical protein n=1 Tax=Novosphingobium sp. TaxID=1874826 RepID=UPI0028AC997B|nr:hypothetical protein [Novosphingobium sp.]